MKIKKKRKASITIGLQMVLLPEYADEVIPLAKLGKDLGVDYLVIKHCSDDEKGRLGVDYSWYKTPIAQKLLLAAESLSTESYSVQVKWSKIMTGRDRKYSRCYGPPVLTDVRYGIVAPCGSFFHNRYKRYHIGDLKEKSFKEIWNSPEYKEVMGHLASNNFDAKTQCATLCLQDKVNEVLNDLVENDKPLKEVDAKKYSNAPKLCIILGKTLEKKYPPYINDKSGLSLEYRYAFASLTNLLERIRDNDAARTRNLALKAFRHRKIKTYIEYFNDLGYRDVKTDANKLSINLLNDNITLLNTLRKSTGVRNK